MENENKPMVDMNGEIKKLSRARSLTDYYNAHLHKMIAAEINIERLKGRDPKEVMAERAVTMPGMDRPVIRKILIGEELKHQEGVYKDNAELIDAIDILLRAEEANIKTNAKSKK